VDAVQCAVEAQAALTEAIASRPIDKRINFRIGIHIGDVMGRGGDLLQQVKNIGPTPLASLPKPLAVQRLPRTAS